MILACLTSSMPIILNRVVTRLLIAPRIAYPIYPLTHCNVRDSLTDRAYLCFCIITLPF
nr:MAG TPA: hypothetical protein [Bacteriophage sp.]